MSRDEELAADYLDARDARPALRPEDYLASRGENSVTALEAIRCALAIEAALQAGDDRGDELPHGLRDHRILAELGEGGMGRVLELGKGDLRFALKRLHPGAAADPHARRRFRREAEILGGLDHPGVVRVVAADTEDPRPWILFKRVEGRPLSALERPLELDRALRLLRQLTEAVAAAHARGLVHRDIKPANIVIRPDDRPVLLDFGLATLADASTLTGTGDVLGTPSYMAPEQARGLPADHRADIHALGLLLFELATGRAARPPGSRDEVLRAVESGRLPRPSRLLPGLPEALDRIVLQAAAREPAHRYDSAAALGEDLDRLITGGSVRARPPGRLRLLAASARRHPLGLALGGAALLAALAIGFGVGRGRAANETDFERVFDRGLAAWSEGHEERARRALLELREQAPRDPRTLRLDALIGARPSADADELTSMLLEAKEALDGRHPEVAFALARRAAERQRSSTPAAVLVGQSARAREELEWAEALLAEGIERNPGSAGLAGARAKVLRRLGRLPEAEAELRRGIGLDPDSAALHHDLAVVLDDSGRVEEAARSARRAAELARGESRAVLNNLAAFLDKLGQSAEAETIYRDLCARFPSQFKSWFNLAFLLDRQGKVREALPLYEKTLELEPACLEATLCLAWIRFTAPDQTLRDLDLAASLLAAARRRHGPDRGPLSRMISDFEKRTGRRLED